MRSKRERSLPMTRPIVTCCLLGGLVAGFASPASALPSIGAISREAQTTALQTVDYRCWWEYGRRHCRFVGDRDDWRYRDRDWRHYRRDRDDRWHWWHRWHHHDR